MRSGAAWIAAAALPLLQRLPPETAHALGLRGLRLLQGHWPPRKEDRTLHVKLFGLDFAHPVGLAAGFDKNGDYVEALGALGFSHIEVGTVTPRPQSGNPKPRLFRQRKARALINRMGFNNRGANYVAEQLQRSAWRGIRGVSIGKNADTPRERAADDYIACLRALYAVADYFAINVSSPNTQGLRDLQAAQALEDIVAALQKERRALEVRHGRRVPLLVKISPDLEPPEMHGLCEVLGKKRIDGVIATNSIAQPDGGLSGAPLAAQSLAVLQRLRVGLGAEFPVISVGGIMSADDVVARLAAGASLVQLYTGFVYRGPALLDEIHRRLSP
jgi:dihydroorotate dehydrogenase